MCNYSECTYMYLIHPYTIMYYNITPLMPTTGATRVAFRRKKTSNSHQTPKMARGDVKNDESMPLDDVEAVQKPSTIGHSQGSLCSFEMSRQTSGGDKEGMCTAHGNIIIKMLLHNNRMWLICWKYCYHWAT